MKLPGAERIILMAATTAAPTVGAIQPGKAFDRAVALDDVAQGYRAWPTACRSS